MNDSSPQQTSVPKSKKYFLSKKWWIIGVVVVLLLGGAVGSWLLISSQKSSQTQDKALLKAKQAAETNRTSADAEKLANTGDTEGANAVYDTAIKQNTDPYQKSILLVDKATLLFNDNLFDEALVIAKEAEAVNESSAVTQFIAQVYEAKGDSPKAVEYYQKTIPLVDKSSPLANQYISYYQSRIEALGGGQ